MDLATFIQKLKDLSAAIRAKQYVVVFTLLTELAVAIMNSIPAPVFGVQPAKAAGTMSFAAMGPVSYDGLADQLDILTQKHAAAAGVTLAQSSLKDEVIPILCQLHWKCWGFS